jgi:hypothetical protein
MGPEAEFEVSGFKRRFHGEAGQHEPLKKVREDKGKRHSIACEFGES